MTQLDLTDLGAKNHFFAALDTGLGNKFLLFIKIWCVRF